VAEGNSFAKLGNSFDTPVTHRWLLLSILCGAALEQWISLLVFQKLVPVVDISQ